MKILALDASTKACSVSLLVDDRFYTQFEMAPQRHANLILGMVERVFEQANISGSALDALAFSDGPGAFTGVRIAAGVVQGLAFGWQKPVISVTSLEALAWQAWQQTQVSPVFASLDARMQELYCQVCTIEQGHLSSEPPKLLTEQGALAFLNSNPADLGIGDIGPEFPAVVDALPKWIEAYPSAEAVAAVASQRIHDAKPVTEQVPVPVYLRNDVAEKPRAV
ncbi:MAG: tRNA (adenosine(37)-N6)-threonylcarbamoyltransferase complex dimerization subunit type 1 TsaB [Hydrogenovibrio sp.]|nr:tRNA (adenosine(37)-N6)-threonylcarbamoyltransferase complex dimerization subunit type 1 TsaB [Hydrogenovibrio sp.]